MWTTLMTLWLALSGPARTRTAQRRPAFRRPACRPRVEGLEDRIPPAVFTVNTVDDTPAVDLVTGQDSAGNVSLRSAIQAANATPGPDEIYFAISGSGVHTIRPGSALDPITDPVIIDGYTQPGASANTLAAGSNAVLQIELDLSNLSNLAGSDYGLRLTATAGGSTIRGLALNRNPAPIATAYGIWLDNSSNNHIEGNFLGTDVSGTQLPPGVVIPFTQFVNITPVTGIEVAGGTRNVIGGFSAADRNLISGWHHAIGLEDSGSTVVGNLVGTDLTGTRALGNWTGIGLGADSGGTIEGNLISGNSAGIVMPGGGFTGADHFVVQNNLIGTEVTGTSGTGADGQPIGNRSVGIGIVIGSHDNTITGNTIAFNGWSPIIDPVTGKPWPHGAGVAVINFRGAPYGNRILGNSIHDNAGLGIDLGGGYPHPGPDGVTLNDSHPDHSGPNHFQNFPVLTSASSSASGTAVWGTFDEAAEPNTAIRLEFFASPRADPTGYGEGQTYLGWALVTTDVNGHASFSAADEHAASNGAAAGLDPCPAGQVVLSATATNFSTGDTSEFSYARALTVATLTSSANLAEPGQPVTLTATVGAAAPGFATPTGSVDFVDTTTNTDLGSVVLSGGSAALTTSGLAPGTHVIEAIYGGDSTFLGSNTTLSQVVKATPVFSAVGTTIITDGTPSVTLTGTLSGYGSLIPTGSVTVTLDSLGQTVPLGADGSFTATFATGSLSVGAHTLTFSYGGDANFTGASASGTLDDTYGVLALFNQGKAKHAGSTLPVQIELTGAGGQDVSSASVTLTALGIAATADTTDTVGVADPANVGTLAPVQAPGGSNPGNVFRFQGGTNPFYTYNLAIPPGLAAGTYRLYFSVAGDPLDHWVTFAVA